jgi:hypothetical protein
MCSKTPYLAPSPKASESKFFTRILLAIVPSGFSRGVKRKRCYYTTSQEFF